MATLVNKDPVEALVQYVLDIKPYHTKIIDVLVEYIYTDPLNVTITDEIEFNFGLDLNRYTYDFCSTGFDTDPFDSPIDGDPQYYNPLTGMWETYYNFGYYDGGCEDVNENFVHVVFDEDIQFEQGSELVYYDNVNVYANDTTSSLGYDTFGFGEAGFSIERVRNNVNIDDTGIEVTVDSVTNVFTTTVPHNFVNDQEIYFWKVGGGLPYYDHYGDDVQMMPYDPYFVIYVSPTEFKIAFELSGSEMDILDPTSFGLESYGTFYTGIGELQPFLRVDTIQNDNLTIDSVQDGVTMSNELIFNQQTPDTGANSTKAQASITDSIEIFVTHLELTDQIGVGFTETADADINNGGLGFVGSWDAPYWDVGGYDENLGVIVRLYSS